MISNKTKFKTELIVRPDDIDLNNHVHSSKYMDYVLFARFDQMERCYGFSMDEFIKIGFGWVMTDSFMQFKRPLTLPDIAVITTWVESFDKNIVEVYFTIHVKATNKLSCNGWFKYSMIDLQTKRAAHIPDEIATKYMI